MQTLKKLLTLLTIAERKEAGVLLGMICVMAFLDVMGVVSIMPFMAVLANPDLIYSNALLNKAFIISRQIGIHTPEDFLFALGLLVFLLLVASLSFKAIVNYKQINFALMREYSIGRRLVEGYLCQPYSWFLNRHSADLGKTILSEVSNVIGFGIAPLMNLIAQIMVTLALLILLMVVDPILSLSVGVFLGLAYLCIYIIMRKWLLHLGHARTQANKERFTALNEAFGASKEVKVHGLERMYTQRFSKPAEIYAKGQAKAQAITILPRFALEAFAFGGMLLIILYLMKKSVDFGDAVPIIALYVLAGYRLMPALQQIYHAFSAIRFVSPSLDSVHKDLISLQDANTYAINENLPSMQLAEAIRIYQASYTYPNAQYPALRGINLTIPAQSKVGFVGTTGSGKTTTVDLILGLLEPQEGNLSIDGKIITTSNRRQWQRTIGYVPQHIYLADDSVASNIAFGARPSEINQLSVERAAKVANLHEFVINELPQGYATNVGERGVRLSGGQRQRIGIARALYKNPRVLILDEATSALDNITEKVMMEALDNLGQEVTVILIAHRLSTVEKCDHIYLLERGEIKAEGTYKQLIKHSEQFAMMAGLNT